MALLKKTPAAQWPLVAQFDFSITDTMARVADGVAQAFSGASAAYDVIPLPYGAQVIGGDVVVLTVSDDTGTATMSVGDSASATRYLGATSIKAAARTALVPTGYQGLGESIRLTVANQNANATTGRVRTTVLFTVEGRASENLKTT